MSERSLELSALSAEQCQKVEIIFCDIDDTLTFEGRLPAESYAALWKAHEAGLMVIPVTGRPAGWVDHIARMWPVKAVVGENGGLYFWMTEEGLQRHYLQSAEVRAQNRRKLDELAKRIFREVPRAGLASDQQYREFDLAIDFCEDVEPLEEEEIQRIVELFEEAGATVKISSIHVNGWYGQFDKLTTCRQMAQELLGLDEVSLREKAIFCGDSPNDEPMFSFFPLSIGVANVRRFLPKMEHHPSYITPSEGGFGFAELIDYLLSMKKKSSN